MATVKLTTAAGKASKTSVDLDEAYFDVQPNVAVMHQVVTAQLAARRAGTQQASSPAAAMSAVTRTYVAGSKGRTP